MIAFSAMLADWLGREGGKAFPRKRHLEQLVAALKQPPTSGPGTHNSVQSPLA